MTETEIETPTDEVPTPKAPKAKKVPKAKEVQKPQMANRYRLFDDGQGDYRIYEVANHDGVPKGTLLPIAGVPGFTQVELAKKWVNNSGDKLQGKQIMILKGCEMCSVRVQTQTVVTPSWKPRKAWTGPAAQEAGGA